MGFENTDLGDMVGKLSDTVNVLATSPHAIKQRLKDAILGGFAFIFGDRLNTYPEIKAEYTSIIERLSIAEVKQGLFDASIDLMSDDEAVQLAKDIMELKSTVHSAYNANVNSNK
jgi:hypothetical protein